MEHRIDPLIAERAPWLYGTLPGSRFARRCLHRLLGYDKTLEIAKSLEDAPTDAIMARMGNRLARMVHSSGMGHIPAHGPALIVANHPTGIADGIILHSLIAARRPDTYFFANRDILRVFPQMETMIAPVESREDKRSHAKTRETMAYLRRATAAGRLGVIFPSGRLAKRRGLQLCERPWMQSAAMLARKFDIPAIPVNIQARNSALFYLFDLIHPTLRDITLFHETLNKDRQPFKITMGEPISAAALPRNADEATRMLRKATLALGGADAPYVNLVAASRSLSKPPQA
ncbi:1-acyl-sn-glycerol-3-phosphate acyltransferase [Yoonia sp. SS1-5]|uniref:1-acyl-sn-glycerol-3-phosphate acyltransferase n=1 Tax=Yoonia rhodophyticola TaxID=3137370 RepID=A0AAN0M863_9RHOB